MEVRELTDQDHEVLGAEFCSGYTDVYGKWNTGFYCPSLGNGETVYCCGTTTYKYCCTRKDQQPTFGVSQSVVLGSALGAILMLILVTLVSCIVCRKCLPYRRQHPSLGGGPLYSIHCSSTASGVANMYSFTGHNTASTTPMDAQDPHTLVDLDYINEQEHGGPHPRGHGSRGGCRGDHIPSEPPPPYNNADSPVNPLLCPDSEERRRNPGLSLSNTSSFTQFNPVQNHTSCQRFAQAPTNSIITPEENMYWSTKF